MTRFTATVQGWLLLAPAMALLALFTHWPAVATLLDSFYATARPRRPAAFTGVDNYRQMIDDPIFWQAVVNNLWFAIGTIPISMALALLMALWVNDSLPGRALVRMAYFTPTVLPMIAVANIWLFFYTPQYGLLAQGLALFGVASQNWLGSKDTALACVTIVAIWKEAGFFMIFYLAALQQIPPNLRRGSFAGGCLTLLLFPPRTVPAPDANHAVRVRQRGHQCLPHCRPHCRHDAWRAR